MIVLGGRTNTVGENVQLEVYETESSEWKKFNSLQRFRHTVWSIDSNIFMHGGFENENPNIPTNSIMKLDLAALFSKTPNFLAKLDQSIGLKGKAKNEKGSTPESTEPSTGSQPMQNLARMKNKIKLDKAEVEAKPGGGKTVQMTMARLEEGKSGGAGGASSQQPSMQKDTLYNLFLNHLLRPREWTAQFDGNGYFAFRREHIIALAEEC